MYPYNPKMSQKIQTNVDGIAADRGFIAHVNFSEPAAQSITAILSATALTSLLNSALNGSDIDVYIIV